MPISLPNAVVGKVVTRFPPEPSWMLDLGHCKASLMNQFVATQFQGRWILRFDDTNPKTCSRENVEAYLRDFPLLGLQPDRITYASDYFGPMIDTATDLIKAGFIYADDTPSDEMRAQRLAKLPSPQRDRSVEDSLAAWAEMQSRSETGRRFCLKFKLSPESENGALRDPVAWRGIDEPHYKTGTRYRVYPTYDFAAPWLDLAEGVTHALRTLEFRDRDELYNAVQQAVVKLHPQWVASNIWEFPRIHMSYTPQAKVHQKALLAAGLVEGPTDPRLPTLRGLMRAGCHPDALKAFLLEQVSPARKETHHSWDKLWTINRRLLDPTAARHMAVADEGRVLLTVLDGPTDPHEIAVQWKQGHIVRVVPYRQVWIDQEDAQLLSEGDEVTLLAWGNVVVKSVTHGSEVPTQQQQQQVLQQSEVPQHSSSPQQQAAVADASAHAGVYQQLQQQQQQFEEPDIPSCTAASRSSSKPPLTPTASSLKGLTPAGIAAAAANGPGSDTSSSGLGMPTSTDPEAAAAAAAAAGVFSGFRDVLALRDELVGAQGKGLFGGSSCCSTAGSTSVAALTGLLSEVEEAIEEVLQASTDVICAESSATSSSVEYDQHQHAQQQSDSTPRATPDNQHTHPAASPAVTAITAVLNPTGNPKASKLKLHWLPALPDQLLPLKLVRFGHPVLVEKVTEDVDVVAQFNHDSRVKSRAWGDPSLLASAQRGNVVQLQRKGFYIIDQVVMKQDSRYTACGPAAPSTVNGVAHMPLLATDAVVPTGAEATAASVGVAAGHPGVRVAAEGADEQQQQQQQVTLQCLKPGDVEELILFFIPDGHTKHDAAVPAQHCV